MLEKPNKKVNYSLTSKLENIPNIFDSHNEVIN